MQQVAKAAHAAQRRAAVLDGRRRKLAAEQLKEKAPKGDAKKLALADKMLAEAVVILTRAEAAAKQPLTTDFNPRQIINYPKLSTGRRLALAKWIADKDNPLTARIAVNHICCATSARRLCRASSTSGRNGRLPSHPALLDWLAAEFMAPSLPSPPEGRGVGGEGVEHEVRCTPDIRHQQRLPARPRRRRSTT